MRRSLLLVAIVVVGIWLVCAPGVVAQDSCCFNGDERDPHQECINGTCQWVQGCGLDDCSFCTLCSADEEWACIDSGGNWDANSCACYYGCDPDGSQESACIESGGTWDAMSCTCYMTDPCNPGPEVITYESQPYDCSYCDGSYYYPCSCVDKVYTQFCQDGSVYSERPQGAQTCSPPDPPPNVCDSGGGGGGGGGDCWATGDCWCDSNWGICCEWDLCYEMTF